MTLVAQKIKILSKLTVRGSALFSFSDTKQGFTVPRGKQRCMETGLCNICKFCSCLLYVSLLLIQFFQLDMIFSIAFNLRIELTKQMTDQEDIIILTKLVFDDNNQER